MKGCWTKYDAVYHCNFQFLFTHRALNGDNICRQNGAVKLTFVSHGHWIVEKLERIKINDWMKSGELGNRKNPTVDHA